MKKQTMVEVFVTRKEFLKLSAVIRRRTLRKQAKDYIRMQELDGLKARTK